MTEHFRTYSVESNELKTLMAKRNRLAEQLNALRSKVLVNTIAFACAFSGLVEAVRIFRQ